jgi:hypothetical protein
MGWGYDYYQLVDFDILTKHTQLLVDDIYNKNFLKKYFKKGLIYKVLKSLKTSYDKSKILKYRHKIMYFIPILEEEKRFCDKIFSKNMKYIDWKYPSTLRFEEVVFNKNKSRPAILLGNSESIINNHLEIIDIMDNFKVKQKIIIPASYRSDPKYKKYLMNYCRTTTLNVEFIHDYLPKAEYFDLIGQCEIAIFNSLRQNALGNIAMLLLLGCKIYLNVRNPLYEYLKSNRIVIFNIDQIGVDSWDEPLDIATIENNRSKVLQLYDDKANKYRTLNLLKSLNEELS